MSETSRSPATGRWLALPCDLLREMDAAELDDATAVLNVAAWTYSAANLTDGVLTAREAARLQSATPRRRKALEAKGFWHTTGDGKIELIGFLAVNATRERVQVRRAQAAERQQRVRDRASTDPADDLPDADRHDERHAVRHAALPSPSPSPSLSPFPESQEGEGNVSPEDQDAVDPRIAGRTEGANAQPHRRSRERRDDDLSSSGRGRVRVRRTGRSTASSGRASPPRWEEQPWAPVRNAWEARGLGYEASPGQRSRLWPVLMEFPDDVGDWVAEAPIEDSSTYGVVAHVLAAAERERLRRRLPALFAELTEEERARWDELEDSWPGFSNNRMVRARQTGEGLPDIVPGENPFRLALPAMVKELDELHTWLTGKRPKNDASEDAGDAWTNL